MSVQDGRLGEAMLDGSCAVHILALPIRQLCPVLVHEFGHLAGYGHTNDGGIMDPNGSRAWAACDTLVTVAAWAADTAGVTPDQCAPASRVVFYCARLRVTVTLRDGRPVGAIASPRRWTRRPLRRHVRDHARNHRIRARDRARSRKLKRHVPAAHGSAVASLRYGRDGA